MNRFGPRTLKGHETLLEKASWLYFEGGESCWNGPSRSIEVTSISLNPNPIF